MSHAASTPLQPLPIESPALLHNSGWAPRAKISWHGFRRQPYVDEEILIQEAKSKGTWLNCNYRVYESDARYTPNWNNCGALLRVLEPEHALSEKEAEFELLKRIDAHAKALRLPPFLMTADEFNPTMGVELSHPLTTFVALAKSTGSVWMKEREPRLAPLHNPTAVSHATARPGVFVEWRAGLFFPKGLPPGLLKAVRTEYQKLTQFQQKTAQAADKAYQNLTQVRFQSPAGGKP
jgi:hypothetical protein